MKEDRWIKSCQGDLYRIVWYVDQNESVRARRCVGWRNRKRWRKLRRTLEKKGKCGNGSRRLMRGPEAFGKDDRDLRICRVVHEFKRSRD